MRDELLERLEKIEDERRRLLEEAQREAQQELQDLRGEIAETRRAMARLRQPVEALQALEEKVEELAEDVQQPIQRLEEQGALSSGSLGLGKPRAIRLGDKVRLRMPGSAAGGIQGVVSALSEEEAEVQMGALRVRTRLAELELAGGEAAAGRQSTATGRRAPSEVEPKRSPKSIVLPESPGLELDLRGKTSEEALEALERYLDAAYLAGLPWVRIIHGKGTGKLREAVRRFLRGHPQVRSFEPGGDKEGGEGVTVVKLAN